MKVTHEGKKPVLVFDYDRTLTLDDLVIPSPTVEVLKRVNQKKLATLGVVSGRQLEFLKAVNDRTFGAFSFLVAENGAITYDVGSHSLKVIGEEWSKKMRRALATPDLGVNFGDIIAAGHVRNLERIQKALSEKGLDANVVPNRDSVMIIPPGVDKGSGVLSAISKYGPRNKIQLICFGDGENDLSLFGAADLRVAVSNAVEPLRKLADEITSLPGGLGVAEYLRKNFIE